MPYFNISWVGLFLFLYFLGESSLFYFIYLLMYILLLVVWFVVFLILLSVVVIPNYVALPPSLFKSKSLPFRSVMC